MHKNTHKQDNNIFPILCFIFNIFRSFTLISKLCLLICIHGQLVEAWVDLDMCWCRLSGDVTSDC